MMASHLREAIIEVQLRSERLEGWTEGRKEPSMYIMKESEAGSVFKLFLRSTRMKGSDRR